MFVRINLTSEAKKWMRAHIILLFEMFIFTFVAELIALFTRDKRKVWKVLESARQQPRPHRVGVKLMISIDLLQWESRERSSIPRLTLIGTRGESETPRFGIGSNLLVNFTWNYEVGQIRTGVDLDRNLARMTEQSVRRNWQRVEGPRTWNAPGPTRYKYGIGGSHGCHTGSTSNKLAFVHFHYMGADGG